jgi:hypothetical protein
VNVNEQIVKLRYGIRRNRWYVALGLSLIGVIAGVLFGFAGNLAAMIIFACMFVVGLWLRP